MPQMRMCLALIVLAVAPVWAQEGSTSPQPVPAYGVDTSADNTKSSGDRMLTPPPVSGQTYPIAFTSEERSNYLRGGMTFTSAYTDNAVGAVNGHPVSDVSYSLAPSLALDETTPRSHLLLTYAPGFTFYQRLSSRNEADQNALLEFEYRLSPYVTFSARDSVQKSSSVFNQPDLASSGGVSGGAEGANFSVNAPIADQLSNLGNLGLTCQFSLNSMIGAAGTFTNLHYPNQAQVPGLFDSSSQAGLAFYSLRVSKINYFGATYEYQRLISYPTGGISETQTHAALLFYTVYPTPRLSISLFGGPQHSDSVLPAPVLPAREWTPAAGGSVSWQGQSNSFALSYLHSIAGGGGLLGPVQLDSVNASVRQRIAKTLSGSLTGGYAQNDLLGKFVAGPSNGHSISGTASLQQRLGQHMNLQLGYTRLHQDYSDVAVISSVPNTNREFVSLSYQFAAALGR